MKAVVLVVLVLLASCTTMAPPDDAAVPLRDAGPAYCRVFVQDCWCHLAGSNAYCFRTYGDCAYNERFGGLAETEPCLFWPAPDGGQ